VLQVVAASDLQPVAVVEGNVAVVEEAVRRPS
jgi:hypothetical protein